MFEHPSYIVLHVPPPAAEMVRNLRRRYDPVRAELAVEISITGSCGLGGIIAGQEPDAVFAEIDRVAAATAPFEAEFARIRRFHNTGIYYFAVADPENFIALHRRLSCTAIRFQPNHWPYEPHCTLKLRGNMTEEEEAELLSLELPPNRFNVNTLSVYELETSLQPVLRYRRLLGSQS
ncbi:MAG: 2'-5' RNA ligase family protein [Victivallales bacterium]|nr:2'-5' RNA ligase family protein [Victivallales bacterium]